MKQRQEAACTAPYFWLVLNLLESEQHQHVNIFLLIAVWPFPEYVSADGVHAGPKKNPTFADWPGRFFFGSTLTFWR